MRQTHACAVGYSWWSSLHTPTMVGESHRQTEERDGKTSHEKQPDGGTIAVDTRSGREGRITGGAGPYVQLRPVGGGVEWDVPPDLVQPADRVEELRARL